MLMSNMQMKHWLTKYALIAIISRTEIWNIGKRQDQHIKDFGFLSILSYTINQRILLTARESFHHIFRKKKKKVRQLIHEQTPLRTQNGQGYAFVKLFLFNFTKALTQFVQCRRAAALSWNSLPLITSHLDKGITPLECNDCCQPLCPVSM